MLRYVRSTFFGFFSREGNGSNDNGGGGGGSSSSECSTNCCGTDQEDQSSVVINVNRYAPIDEKVFQVTRSEKDLDRLCKKKKKKKEEKRKKKSVKARTTPSFPCKSSIRSSSSGSRRGSIVKPFCQVLRFEPFGRKDEGPIVASLSDEDNLDFDRLSVNRYQSEFQELELIGRGKFGSVYRCVNRLDGREYAVKQSEPLLRSAFGQRRARNEVHANAVLLGHPNIVRYYSAWLENGRVHVQQEYCNAGDLGSLVDGMREEFKFFKETELRRLALHVAEGLRCMHRENLVHLDIKPENIFMTKRRVRAEDRLKRRSSKGERFVDEVTYKIGDMGHVTLADNAKELEDEGDSRYLSRELLRDDYSELPKADVFALGLTVYDVAGGGPLPQNGPEWHSLREGNLRRIVRYSDAFHVFLSQLVHVDPKKRFSAADVVQCEYLNKNTDVPVDFQWLSV